jgi:hypothetical protein
MLHFIDNRRVGNWEAARRSTMYDAATAGLAGKRSAEAADEILMPGAR